ncbi:UNKNOWN [Stylonychia lemnae]|uniref:Uncharacterized protein n=1 Tax=Stylonychia lemnae TaxID=5949 RepID=A0A078BDX1_STYLE|nr:UNKNOWN [Stylonychia lemnae]|eukprot:CDW91362.1 UNKNOWN [Stylonychia lemnae]
MQKKQGGGKDQRPKTPRAQPQQQQPNEPDEAFKKQFEAQTNEELQKMIIELENQEKSVMQKNKDIRAENNLLRAILIDDLNVTISSHDVQKKEKKDRKEKKNKDKGGDKGDSKHQQEEEKKGNEANQPQEKQHNNKQKKNKQPKDTNNTQGGPKDNTQHQGSDIRQVHIEKQDKGGKQKKQKGGEQAEKHYVKKGQQESSHKEETKEGDHKEEKGQKAQPKKKEFVPACFKETSGNADVDKAKADLLEAYLVNQIPQIEAALEKASALTHEGQLDKVIEACKNRIERLQLSAPQ